jgi:hypothetical protein
MTDHRKLWEKLEKMLGGDKNPFETPIGPTSECLSANQIVNYVQYQDREPKIVEHLSKCLFCSKRVITLSKLVSNTD